MTSADPSARWEPEDGKPSPSLYYLRTFDRVAHLRSFTRAGQELALSQPAVSAHVRALEQYYHCALFQVRHRRVCLTPEAEALQAFTQRVFQLLQEADRAVLATRRGEGGHLLVGASQTIGTYVLPAALHEFRQTHPGVDIEVSIGSTAQVVARVLSERVPFGLVEAPTSHRDLETRPFGEDQVILVAPPDHPWAMAGEVSCADLHGRPLLRRERGSTQDQVDAMLEQAGIDMPTALVVDSTDALKQTVLAGLGVAWLPGTVVARELRERHLVGITVASLTMRRVFYAIARRGVSLPPVADLFLHLLQSHVAPVSGSSPAL